MLLQPGTKLGPYEISAQIGEGGMGEVYQATDTNLDRQVAIKVLPDAVAQDPERLARFDREAKTLAALNHPGIAAIYGVEKQDGQTALVMELVEGPTLADRIAQGAIPVDEALPISKQIAEALEAAHEQGIIHRDLKPANIKLRPDGTVKVLDFGLAKAMEQPGASSPSVSQSPTITTPAMTQMGMILGTAAYMSPEQAKGRAADKRSDVWAFGAVLYEMLTGRRAFEGDDVSDTMAAVLKMEPSWDVLPANLSPVISTYLRRCLHKDPKQRIHDVADLRLALEGAFETGVSPGAEAAVMPQPAVWRRGLPLAIASLVTAIIVSLVAWSLSPSVEPPVVSRFNYDLPDGQQFSNASSSVVEFSPDGRQLVYSTSGGLYLRSMGELEARLVPGTESADLWNPFIAADGQSVGFFDVTTSELKRIATSGGTPVVICAATLPFGVSWGTDNTILFGQTDGIRRVSANGGTPELVIPATEGEQVHGPQLLPDGESVLFSVTTSTGPTRWDVAQIVVQSLRTGERTVVLQGGSDARYVPTGHLVYASRDALYAIAFDVDSLTVRGGSVPVVEGVRRAASPESNTGTANFGVSVQGSLVYVPGTAAASSDRTLALVGRDGVVAPLPVPRAEYLSPRLSPDGETLVVQTVEAEGNVLWTYDLASDSQIQQLTFEGDNRRPVWTPDGQRITFASDRDGPMSLYWVPADGSGAPERLTTAEPGTSHWPQSWTPDGQTLLFNVQRDLITDWDIWTLSVTGRETQSLYDTPRTTYMGAEISPDGRWLAFGAGASSAAVDIYVEPFPLTGSRRRISQDGGYWPLWSRAGDRLFYRLRSTSPGLTLKSVDIVTQPAFAFSNEQTPPIDGFTVVGYSREYDSTLDGERLLMVFPADGTAGGDAARPQIVVVQNWFTELERLVPTE